MLSSLHLEVQTVIGEKHLRVFHARKCLQSIRLTLGCNF